MTLADIRSERLGESSADTEGDALHLCRLAAESIFLGQFEDARRALGTLWQGVGSRPRTDGFSLPTAAEVFLQCGVLSGWIGSSQHIGGAQEAAKDLISQALRTFESLGEAAKVSEAQYELAICYWRLGALDEARVILFEALRGLPIDDVGPRAKILIRQTLVEISARRYHDAWNILREAAPVFEHANEALKGRWHGQRALVLRRLATAEGRADYVDRAIIEFTAAIYHYERANHSRYCGNNLNNLAMLLHRIGRYEEAHENLDRARSIFVNLKDSGSVAQVDDTRARVLVAEGRYEEARRVIAGAIRALEEGGEQALLADAMVVQGVALGRLGEHEKSLELLRSAIDTAEYAGAPESAGHAALALIEEHGAERLSVAEAYEAYRRADRLLAHTQDVEDVARLRACARIVLDGQYAGARHGEKFSLPHAVKEFEAGFIKQALDVEGGSVSRAARRLGVTHQTLAHMLKSRHEALLGARTPAVPRRRSIIRIREARRPPNCALPAPLEFVTILHVEDNALVAGVVKDMLEVEGWRVEGCAEASAGLRQLEGDARYDLLIVDHDLPDMSGLDLVRRVRGLPMRHSLPVIMLSANECEADARVAGIDAFLRKPDGVSSLAETVTRLLDAEG